MSIKLFEYADQFFFQRKKKRLRRNFFFYFIFLSLGIKSLTVSLQPDGCDAACFCVKDRKTVLQSVSALSQRKWMDNKLKT